MTQVSDAREPGGHDHDRPDPHEPHEPQELHGSVTGHQPVHDTTRQVPVVPAGVPGATRETVTCPECGHVAEVTLNRRESLDFCRHCDFPLFWTPAQIVLGDDGARDGASLRRLPGTGGTVSVASVPCPHCAESNTLRALTCIRCGLPMVVAAPVPLPPQPVEPVAVVEPTPRVPAWLWVLLAVSLVLVVGLGIWTYVER